MPRRRSWFQARCLVTGASSGLGRALTTELVRSGARVAMTGRSATKLDAVFDALIAQGADPDTLCPAVADLTVPDDRQRLLDRVSEQFGALDLVVNCAGVGATGHFETHDPTVLRQVFEINLFALAEFTREVLPLLRRGQRPALVNVGSIVARRGLPGRSEYSASKFAVAGFTESIRSEWSKYGIHVLLLNPGFIATDFELHLIIDNARYPVTDRRKMTANAVARATLKAVLRGQNELTLTPSGRLLLALNRLSPRFIDWIFHRWTLRLYPDAPILHPQSSQASPDHQVAASGENH